MRQEFSEFIDQGVEEIGPDSTCSKRRGSAAAAVREAALRFCGSRGGFFLHSHRSSGLGVLCAPAPPAATCRLQQR
jgi:hypothetical protein